MKKAFYLLCFCLSSICAHAACTLAKPVIDQTRLKKEALVQALTVLNPSEATALLKNGSTLYIRFEGCTHIGMQAVLWVPAPAWADTLPAFKDTKFWTKKALEAATLGFNPEQAKTFKTLLDNKKTKANTDASTFKISAETEGAEAFSVSGERLSSGVLLIVEYAFSG